MSTWPVASAVVLGSLVIGAALLVGSRYENIGFAGGFFIHDRWSGAAQVCVAEGLPPDTRLECVRMQERYDRPFNISGRVNPPVSPETLAPREGGGDALERLLRK